MERLQELQYIVAGGEKVVCGERLSPRSTRGYLKTSLRCKQESLRIKNANPRKSSPGKLPTPSGEWRRMSLPAMLVGETVGEILQASQFAREIVTSSARKPLSGDPKTPMSVQRKQRLSSSHHNNEDSEFRAKRRREKQVKLQSIRKDSDSPVLRRARSRINFKASSPLISQDKENCRYLANRVSPRHKPWAKKTVLFPNPLFHSSPTSTNPKFTRTKSPIIPINRTKTPHKFLIKTRSPPLLSPKSIKTPHKFLIKTKSPTRRSLSPSTRSPTARAPPSPAATRLRRSFSPSRLANRLISPLKTRKGLAMKKSVDGFGLLSGLKKQMPAAVRFPSR